MNIQTVYILKEKETGVLHMFQYAPTQDFSGRSDSDRLFMQVGLKPINPSHGLKGEIECQFMNISNDTLTIEGGKKCMCIVMGMYQFDWDMSKPIGERKTDISKSIDYDRYLMEFLLTQEQH